MKIGRLIGGIMVVVGGCIALFNAYAVLFMTGGSEAAEYARSIGVSTTILFSFLILIGGVLLCVDKTTGGIIALIGGTVYLIGLFIPVNPGADPWEISPFTVNLLSFFSLDRFLLTYLPFLLAIGGGFMGIFYRSEIIIYETK